MSMTLMERYALHRTLEISESELVELGIEERAALDVRTPEQRELLERCLDKILTDSEHWYQGSWFGFKSLDNETSGYLPMPVVGAEVALCETTACLAGHALLMSGWRVVIDDVDSDDVDTDGSVWTSASLCPPGDRDHGTYSVEGAAVLGLPLRLGRRLFSMTEECTAQEFTDWVRAQVDAWPTLVPTPDQARG